MSEKHTTISEIYEQTVKDFIEPIDTKNSSVEKTDDITQIFHLLESHNHLWVVDDKETMQLCGVITESDTIQLFAPAYPTQAFDKPRIQSFQFGLSSVAEEIMSKQPITVALDTKISDVIVKMAQHRIKQVAVIDENTRLIGEVRVHRLIQEYLKRKPDFSTGENTDIPGKTILDTL
ncbi:MAG: CBS domain-containing protein [Candidatus Thermoplasmatota archaeon]|nr:CBS domain-containing protein [Candidatus Thermoplasmatota archaeon]